MDFHTRPQEMQLAKLKERPARPAKESGGKIKKMIFESNKSTVRLFNEFPQDARVSRGKASTTRLYSYFKKM